MTDFRSFLCRSLELLEAHSPDGYQAVCQRLADRTVSINVDGERLAVSQSRSSLRVHEPPVTVAASAAASSATLAALLDGELALNDAVLADQVLLVGSLGNLVAFYEALQAYFLGAVRCPEFSSLLDEFFSAKRGRSEHAHADAS